MPYWANNFVPIFMTSAQLMIYLVLSKQKFS